ncbi:hypothetical protein [Psychrobacillus sp. FSL K6-1415]|uniref:hypothetical protein n=1 Tax=Psychrobacillus sp. FSL K6-1415 TaxID=2921544 RepID=UPI0030F8B9CC
MSEIAKYREKEFKKARISFLKETQHDEALIVILRAHLLVERELNLVLEKCLKYPDKMDLERVTFSQKLNLVYALGMLKDGIYRSINKFNNIRNGCAHSLDYKIDENSVDSIISCLSKDEKNEMESDLGEFKISEQPSIKEKIRLVLAYLHADITVERLVVHLTLRERSIEIEQSELTGIFSTLISK